TKPTWFARTRTGRARSSSARSKPILLEKPMCDEHGLFRARVSQVALARVLCVRDDWSRPEFQRGNPMKRALCITALCLFFSPAFASAADPKVDDILGKWELTAEAAGIPKGSTFDFRKGGKLFVTATVEGKEQTFEFGYDIKGKLLSFSGETR